MNTRDLSTHTPYRAGRGIEEVARDLGRDPAGFVTLSSNENPLGPSPQAVAAVKAAADTVHTYPKASHTDLTIRLAKNWAVEPAQIWLAAGGDGTLDYLARAFLEPGDRVLVPRPGFSYYPMSARFHHATVTGYPVRKEDDFALTPEAVLEAYDGERLVYLTSPHNPTGGCYALDAIRAIADNTREETLVVVDEAYAEYSDLPSARILLDGRDDIAVVRTFSKAYGLAGLRMGYGIVPETWAAAYDRVNTPFAVSEIACRAGMAALDDQIHVERSVTTARWAREYMTDHLDARTWGSQANFVLADVGDATRVTEAAERNGVIVRDCTSFGLPACVRVTCGTEAETERAVEVLNDAV